MEKNILAGKTALPPSMLPGALSMLRPTTLWTLQWSGPNQSLQNLMHFRYYASSMGRFMKPDNIITNIANPQSWNLYTYVNGNPVNFNDPSGHLRNFPLSTDFSYIGLGYSPHFLVSNEERYFYFRTTFGYSAAASAFFSDISGLTSTTNAVLGAAGVSGANVAYSNWVSDALVSGFNFDTETIDALHAIYGMGTAYGIELGFYFSRTNSGGLAIIVIFGTEKNVPAFMWNIPQKSTTQGQMSEYQFFHQQIGFNWESWFLYGHTHLSGYGISDEDVSTYCKTWFKNSKPFGIVIEQNMEGQTVISRIGFSVDFTGLWRIVIEPFKETWRNPW